MQKKDDKEGNKTVCQRERPRKKKESEQKNQNRFARKNILYKPNFGSCACAKIKRGA